MTKMRSPRHHLSHREQQQQHPLASPPTSPRHPHYASHHPERAVYHSPPHSPPAHRQEHYRHQHQHQHQYSHSHSHQHQRGESHGGHPGETDPMLHHSHGPAYPSPTHPPHTHAPAHHAILPVADPDTDPDTEILGTSGDTGVPPAPPPKSPKDSAPLSRRLFHALVHKPTLSRTWEKKGFMEEQGARSAPVGGEIDLERGGLGEYASPRSRPMSLYASPAEIAAFRPLPLMMDVPEHSERHPLEQRQGQVHLHGRGQGMGMGYSAPVTPTQSTRA
ncbi:hypothetical protein IAT38_001920 [Cryptococcus sp. DSM 104549]